MLYREFRFPRIRDVFNNGCPLKCPLNSLVRLLVPPHPNKSFLSHMVNRALPIRYFVAISQPKPRPLLWEKKLKRIPSGIQTHTPSILKSITSWEELNLQRFAQLDTPQWERVYPFRHGKRSFLTNLKSSLRT